MGVEKSINFTIIVKLGKILANSKFDKDLFERNSHFSAQRVYGRHQNMGSKIDHLSLQGGV